MKVVINRCFGGFSISPRAVKALAERKGRECFFFERPMAIYSTDYKPISLEEAEKTRWRWIAFDIPNPAEVIPSNADLDSRPDDRTDPDLIAVVEELGEAANGECAELAIVEIPDGVEWEISEYDGNESIHECHRSWR